MVRYRCQRELSGHAHPSRIEYADYLLGRHRTGPGHPVYAGQRHYASGGCRGGSSFPRSRTRPRFASAARSSAASAKAATAAARRICVLKGADIPAANAAIAISGSGPCASMRSGWGAFSASADLAAKALLYEPYTADTSEAFTSETQEGTPCLPPIL